MTDPHSAAASGAFDYWLACGIFVAAFVVIVSEKVHKTKVALFGAGLVLALGLVSQADAFHSQHLGIDHSVVFLLIGMMILVNILGKSGVFEWTAIRLAKIGQGKPFSIMVMFALATAVISAFLDNVTTVLLFAPVTLLIADELDIDPIPYLIMEAIASNVGGTATLIGDPPNIMIGSRAGIGFMPFLIHLGPVVVVMLVALVGVIWMLFAKKLKVDEARRQHVLAMDESKLITDPALAKKALAVIGIVVVAFITHSFTHVEPATVALFGAATLLLISRLDPHKVLSEIEWPTIFFFIGLFIIVGSVVKVGLITDLSNFVIHVTEPTQESMFATSMVILWFSGFLSAFIDNIPYVATMAPLVVEMAGQVFVGPGTDPTTLTPEVLHHPVLMPVWWALALGACLGGNGTAIGASANVVVLGMAERAGHKISFIRFMAYGMPIMVMTLVISTVYLWLRYY